MAKTHYVPDFGDGQFICGSYPGDKTKETGDPRDVDCKTCIYVMGKRGIGTDLPSRAREAREEGRRRAEQEGEVGNLRQYPVLTMDQHRIMEFVDEWFGEFLKKNADYQHQTFSTGDILGAGGQYAELVRKVFKLHGPMWENKQLNYEQADEIIRDLIGHCFLALLYLEKEQDQGPKDQIDAEIQERLDNIQQAAVARMEEKLL